MTLDATDRAKILEIQASLFDKQATQAPPIVCNLTHCFIFGDLLVDSNNSDTLLSAFHCRISSTKHYHGVNKFKVLTTT